MLFFPSKRDCAYEVIVWDERLLLFVLQSIRVQPKTLTFGDVPVVVVFASHVFFAARCLCLWRPCVFFLYTSVHTHVSPALAVDAIHVDGVCAGRSLCLYLVYLMCCLCLGVAARVYVGSTDVVPVAL